MKLYVTMTSPYARLARIVVHEKALADRVEIIAAKTRTPGSPYYAINPSGRVPYLVTDDGTGLEDSQVICAYLDGLEACPRFHPASDPDWSHRRLEAAGRSMLDGIAVWAREKSRPETERSPTRRAIEVMVERAKRAVRPTGLPLVGHVAAGEPIVAEENVEEYLQVPDVIGGEAGDYILRVRGESMIDAGILDGDFAVVRPAQTASNGEIVVALIGDEATVKRYFKEKDHIRLQPENSSMKPIETTDAQLLGTVVGVFRSIR